MNHIFRLLILVQLLVLFSINISAATDVPFDERKFVSPESRFYPMPFWHINGEMTQEGIKKQLTDAKVKGGFKGVAVLPVGETQPDYLSEKYFDMYRYILDTAKSLDMKVIMYDDTGFPSGTAGGRVEKFNKNYVRRSLIKHELQLNPEKKWRVPVPKGTLMATVAMNTETFERINLAEHVKDGFLHWPSRQGKWKILFFTTDIAPFFKTHPPVDYLNPEAVNKFIEFTYQEYANRFEKYFRDTIEITFFDDVGFLWTEKAWTDKFNEKFVELYKVDPAIYYPALWYDIGPETEAARVALFNTRAELLAEGYPKLVHDWSKKHGLKSTGHPPGNYGIQPVDMHGDIFKFFRHTDYPLMDYIISYGRGRDGFKLISSAAHLYDRPIVATEIYGAFKEPIFDTAMMYRAMMELFARGVNFVVPHGMWYDSKNVRISPLVSPESAKIVAGLPAYSDYVARSCYLLQGGRTVSNIGVLYPIHSLQGAYYFDEPINTVPGGWTYAEADYLKISTLLTQDLQRDFTFIHPEHLVTEQYSVNAGKLLLNNAENYQSYDVVIIPSGKVISVSVLKKIKQFYDDGGKVVATGLLPTRSAEFGRDAEVAELIEAIFGKNPTKKQSIQANTKGGLAVFIAKLDEQHLRNTLIKFAPHPDIIFEKDMKIKSALGVFSYLHKVRDGRDIYFFANSSDDQIKQTVLLKGEHQLEQWNSHSGAIEPLPNLKIVQRAGESYTQVNLELDKVSSVFFISNKK